MTTLHSQRLIAGLLVGVVSTTSVGCKSCRDEQRGGQTDEASVAEPASSVIAGERTSIGGRTGAGPLGNYSLSSADVVLDAPWGQMGRVVEYAGDVDSDGYDDLLVSYRACCRGVDGVAEEPKNDGAFLIYGRERGPNRLSIAESGALFVGEEQRDHLGRTFAGVGDVDGDGFADFALAAPRGDATEGKSRPRVYLVYGQEERFEGVVDLADTPRFRGSASIAGLGEPLAGGDLDGDGYSDVVLSNFGNDEHPEQYVWVFYGGPLRFPLLRDLDDADVVLTASCESCVFAHDMVVADIDSDGAAELVLGIVRRAEDHGELCMISGGARRAGAFAATDLCEFSGVSSEQDDAVGSRLAAPGDVNGDGFVDILVGDWSPGARVFLLAGADDAWPPGSTFDDAPFIILGTGMHQFPVGLSGGDVNGDGYADIVSAGRWGEGKDPGTVYLFYGGDLEGVEHVDAADASFEGLLVGGVPDKAGYGVAADGDFNGDGYADIAVGAMGDAGPTSHSGRVYLIYGGL